MKKYRVFIELQLIKYTKSQIFTLRTYPHSRRCLVKEFFLSGLPAENKSEDVFLNIYFCIGRGAKPCLQYSNIFVESNLQ